eukprot:Skav233773  [mRNA]  locus=scaffold780:87193:87810:- [translate_table: standard]
MARGLVGVALVAVAGSLAFVPGTPPPPGHPPATPDMQTENGWGSLPTLVGGVALGLFFSLATVAPVRAEEAAPAGPSDEEILAKGCDIRLDCDTREKQFAWAKAYYRKYNQETDGKDKKYSQPSTGAGVYRKFKIDWTNPDPSIPDTVDGTYPIRDEEFKKVWEGRQKELKERVEKYLGRPVVEARFNGDYYSKLSPFKSTQGNW